MLSCYDRTGPMKHCKRNSQYYFQKMVTLLMTAEINSLVLLLGFIFILCKSFLIWKSHLYVFPLCVCFINPLILLAEGAVIYFPFVFIFGFQLAVLFLVALGMSHVSVVLCNGTVCFMLAMCVFIWKIGKRLRMDDNLIMQNQ